MARDGAWPDSARELDIAIIGMTGRFPGARNLEEFWRNLRDGVESLSTFTDQQVLAAGVAPGQLEQPHYVKRGGVLQEVELFDSSFFGVYPLEADIMDPQHRIFLEAAWEALEHAGYNPESYPDSIGVFAGSGMNTYLLFNLYANRHVRVTVHGYQLTIGNDKDYLPTRVSYKLNLRGPSVNIQTACSTSLVAIHQACQALLAYQCDMALAGGITVRVPQETGYLYQEGGILSPDGHCRAFDAQAQGTVSGNGVGIVVLKRLVDALADGDTVHAVIKGTAINNDGSLKVGYTAPSVEGQASVIAMSMALAEVEPDSITMIEAHGTGTALGDPIEITALNEVFRRGTNRSQFCAIGSLKTNVGHLDAAAGVASVIKTALALQHRQIPPSLHFQQANPQIDFESSPFFVNRELRAWPKAGREPRRAGVSSFGIGGTNAHAVLEEAPDLPPSDPSREWQLVLLSARTPAALEQATQDLAAHLRSQPDLNLADAAYTLQVGRKAFSQRQSLVCRTIDEAIAGLEGSNPQRLWIGQSSAGPRPVTFMFSGQGAQYANMGAGLYNREPVFRSTLDRCAELLRPHLGLDLRTLLYPAAGQEEEANRQLEQTQFTQPALFALEYALAQLWLAWGVQPEAMIGHSIGEYVAACLAGVFSLEDALQLVATRGRLMQSLPAGAMLSVSLSQEEAAAYADGDLALATVNGPRSCVLAGPPEAVDRLQEQLATQGITARRLHTSHAFHSPMVEPILAPFAEAVRRVRLAPPATPFISNLTSRWIKPEEATDPAYWARHLRQPVRFSEGLSTLAQNPNRLLLEVGPGRTLASLARSHPEVGRSRPVIASIRHPQSDDDDQAFLLAALGQLWVAGVEVDWAGFYGQERRYRIPLPTYPFQRQRHWIEPDADGLQPAMPALGRQQEISRWFYLPTWRQADRPSRRAGNSPHLSEPCLVFVGDQDDSIDQVLVDRLRQEGHQVHTVAAGQGFTELAPNRYVIDPAQPADYGKLLQALERRDALPQRIIHLWSLSAAATDDQRLDQALRLGFDSLLYLARALGELPQPLALEVITSDVQAVTGEEVLCPEQAIILGLCRVIGQEYPQIACHAIDLVARRRRNGQDARIADHLLAEFHAAEREPVVALRGVHRWVQTYEPAPAALVADRGPAALRPGGVYLITGGLGQMGLTLAEHLAEAVQARLALLARSPFPPREQWAEWLTGHDAHDPASQTIRRLQAMEARGAEVLVLQADVADHSQLAAAVQRVIERFGTLHGVVHGAGLVGEDALTPIADLDPATRDRQFRAKVLGAQVLAEVLALWELDFVLLQSSLAAVLGGLGMAAYAAANQFMDAFAQRQRATGETAWLSVNWDAWRFPSPQAEANDGSKGDDDHRSIRTALQELAIRPQQGLEAFRRVLALAGLPQVVVSTVDLEARQQRLRAATAGSLETQDAPAARHQRPALGVPFVAPRNDHERAVAALWEKVLGITPIGVHDDFFELGGHSLLATQIISRLRDAYRVELPLRQLFENPTVAGLAGILDREDGAQQANQAVSATIQPIPRPSDGETGGEDLPLSFGQQRLWFLDQLDPGSPLYNNAAAIRLSGPFDHSALTQALNDIVRRHEGLRTTFQERDGKPQPVIHARFEIEAPLTDLSALAAEAQDAEVMRLAVEEARQPFDLQNGPILRARVLRLADQEHVVFFTMHHIVSDGWSVGVLIQETAALYSAHVAGWRAGSEPAQALPSLPIQYLDFAHWQQQQLAPDSPLRQKQLDYWRAQLANAPPGLELPTDRPRPAVQGSRGANYWFDLPAELVGQLERLGKSENATLFMTLLAAFDVLLHRYSGQNDISVGTPVANRGRPETEGLIGFLLNTLVLRSDLSGNPTFRELLRRVREMALAAYANQDLPFEVLVEELHPRRDMSRSPLFQVMFDLQVTPVPELALPGVTLRRLPIDTGAAKFDLALSLEQQEGRLDGYLNYNCDLFDENTIARMVANFQTLLAGIVANSDRSIDDLPVLAEAERRRLLVDWNGSQPTYPTTPSLVHLLEMQAAAQPDSVAAVLAWSPGAAAAAPWLTYDQLNRRANQLAHRLIEFGVTPGSIVGLCVERSLEMIVGMAAILKAGAAFVPLDPLTPGERLAFQIGDAGTRVLVTHREIWDRLVTDETLPAPAIVLLDDWSCLAGYADQNPKVAIDLADPAYVIYTSGSTGLPKGVVISQGAVAGHCLDMTVHFELTPQDRVLQFAAITFDQALEQIFTTLIAGATLVVRGPEVWTPAEFPAVAAAYGLTVINLPPAYWNQVIHQWSEQPLVDHQVRLVVVGGDALLPETLRFWQASPLREARLLNAYGPTEATITATTFQVPTEADGSAAAGALPIGRPLPHRLAFVLDDKGALVPIGVPGELYLGGAGLAVGYLNRTDLTTERFLPNPFTQEAERQGDKETGTSILPLSPSPPPRPFDTRLYRTGDWARYLPDGNLEFLGRVDNQVKVRGFRVELGEIEAVLVQHPAVQEAVVLAREDSFGEKRLVAYIVPEKGQEVRVIELRHFVERKLPGYMIPSFFLLLDSLPLTANGKIQRQALPDPDIDRSLADAPYATPRTPVEDELVRIWRQVLGLETIGVHDSFFDLGGHSLLATQILSRIRQTYPVELPLRRLFETPTVAGLATIIEESLVSLQDEADLEQLLAELEDLSSDEVNRLLADL